LRLPFVCEGRTLGGEGEADLSDASQTRLNDVANLMNNSPRKTLGWRTPAEATADEIAAFKSTVALDV
jgi:IS30 family transposase